MYVSTVSVTRITDATQHDPLQETFELDVFAQDQESVLHAKRRLMSEWSGFVAAGAAVVLFGSYAVPTKLVATADGLFFQWVQCSGILLVGVVLMCIVGVYTLYPVALLGGACWAVANVTVVPIVDMLGLSLGMLLWGVTNMATGWAVGTFGLGSLLSPDPAPSAPLLNYLGFALAVASIALYLPIKTSVTKKTAALPAEQSPLLPEAAPSMNAVPSETHASDVTDAGPLDATETEAAAAAAAVPPQNSASLKQKLVGCSLALVAGFGYGINMLPVRWVQEHQAPTANPLSFAFSHYVGIWLTSTTLFAAYAIAKRNAPLVNANAVLAALVSGIGWGIANAMWFLANARLGLSTAFPIICTGPSIVASLWGIGYFREIRGLRNLVILAVAFVVTLAGIVLIALSHAVTVG